MKAIISVFVAFTLLILPTFSDASPKWQKLGSQTVTRKVDTDRIVVKHRGKFSKLQLGVTGAGVKINKMVVHFENGGKKEIALGRFIAKGERSRVIDLPGQARDVKSVVINYAAKGVGKNKALVTLWGRR